MGLFGQNPGAPGFAAAPDEQTQLRRLRDLERGSLEAYSDGTLRALVDSLPASVAAQLAAQLAAGISTSTVTASSSVSTPGTVQADTGISSIGVYSNLLTTSYRAVWLTSTGGTGTFGYVPSSRRFKQDIADASLPNIREVMANLRLVTFRYKAAIVELVDGADTEWGVIAEEIHALGLTWLVDYDEDGLPFGVKHERFAFLLILDAQDKQAQIDSITSRLDAAGL